MNGDLSKFTAKAKDVSKNVLKEYKPELESALGFLGQAKDKEVSKDKKAKEEELSL